MITRECRRGTFSWLESDEFVGRALNDFGEYSEGEIELFAQVLQPGDVAVDVGANIGALTVPIAQLVGSTGRVYAYEPGENNLAVLAQNIRQNDLGEFVEIVPFAASDKAGEVEVAPVASPNLWRKPEEKFKLLGDPVKVKTVPIDSLNLQKCKLVKIDVDGMEIETLTGMDNTIKRCRPLIYIENEQEGRQGELIAHLTDRGYRLWWHRPHQYNPDNFRKNKRNWFGRIVSIMMIAIPEELGAIVDGLDEVGDVRDDDDMFEREAWRYERYVKRDPKDMTARLMLAHNLNLMQRTPEALVKIEENLIQDPNHIATRAIKGLIDLQQGNYKDGWPAFELRFLQRNTRLFGGHRKFDVPKWNGEVTNQDILIWSEQGFGDMIMFARFIPVVLELCPNAIFEVHSSIYELFTQSFPWVEFTVLHRTSPHGTSCIVRLPLSVAEATDAAFKRGRGYSAFPFLSAPRSGFDRDLARARQSVIDRYLPSWFATIGAATDAEMTWPSSFDPLNARYAPFSACCIKMANSKILLILRCRHRRASIWLLPWTLPLLIWPELWGKTCGGCSCLTGPGLAMWAVCVILHYLVSSMRNLSANTNSGGLEKACVIDDVIVPRLTRAERKQLVAA